MGAFVACDVTTVVTSLVTSLVTIDIIVAVTISALLTAGPEAAFVTFVTFVVFGSTLDEGQCVVNVYFVLEAEGQSVVNTVV